MQRKESEASRFDWETTKKKVSNKPASNKLHQHHVEKIIHGNHCNKQEIAVKLRLSKQIAH